MGKSGQSNYFQFSVSQQRVFSSLFERKIQYRTMRRKREQRLLFHQRRRAWCSVAGVSHVPFQCAFAQTGCCFASHAGTCVVFRHDTREVNSLLVCDKWCNVEDLVFSGKSRQCFPSTYDVVARTDEHNCNPNRVVITPF